MNNQKYYFQGILQYDGTSFKGFQWQRGVRTVQAELDLALKKILGESVTTAGASRTDSGVHALGQVIKIGSESPMDCLELKTSLNELLPPDIYCSELQLCEETFNPIKHSVSKEYCYLFTTGIDNRNLGEHFIANYPYDLSLEKMKVCGDMIVGQHDFKHFCVTGSNVKTTVREIFQCELREVNPHEILDSRLFPLPKELNHCYEFRIEGTGFLKQMVRLLVSHLWEVGRGRLSLEDFQMLLKGEHQKHDLVKAATPRGLYLYKVSY